MKLNKWKWIISSVIILLPMVFGLIFWNQLPDMMVSHWGADGVADGTASKAFTVFGMPCILLVLHLLLLWVSTVVEKDNRQNPKMAAVCYGIIPALSLVMHLFVYSIALEKNWELTALLPVFIGVLFLVIGNYMPKTTRNRTAGIKLRWTLGNDENWNKTHRLGGKIYFWSGLAIIASALFPIKISVAVMIVMILVSVLVPAIYSYRIYRKHKASGVEYEPVFDKKSDKVAIWITAICVPLILVGTTVLMVTGNIALTYGEADFQIIASYTDDLTVSYAEVETIEYRESFDAGFREMGFASARLSTGTFQNEEFGRYTLYAYTQGEGAVILKQGDKTLVLVGQTQADTLEIYNTLAEKIQ